MEFTDLLCDLGLNDDVKELLEQRRDLFPVHMELILGLTDRNSALSSYKSLEERLGGDDMGMLACQLRAAVHTRELYRKTGISDRIFLDTMGCFRRFLGETLHRTGKLCFDRGWWSYRQLSMCLFRLGQLEFEMVQEPHVIAMHIPSDSRMTPEEVDRSLEQLRGFLPEFYPEYADAPVGCESWLLSPVIRGHLREGSNIRSFQDRFHLLHVVEDAPDVREWLFRVPDGTPVQDFPEGSSLQRDLKNHMLSGGTVGVARGVLK